jgi:hypothetical protein
MAHGIPAIALRGAPMADAGAASGPRASVGEGMIVRDLTDPSLGDFLRGGHATASGGIVNTHSALRIGVAWRCVSLVAGVMATTPLDVIERVSEDVRRPAIGHSVRKLITKRPNHWQTPGEFKKLLTAHKLLRGNG